MKLSFKPVRASRAAGFQGPCGGSQLVLTLYCFQMYNRLPEMMKNGDVGIFPVYYSLKAYHKPATQSTLHTHCSLLFLYFLLVLFIYRIT